MTSVGDDRKTERLTTIEIRKFFQTLNLAYVDSETMEPLSRYSPGMSVVAAVHFHGVRLIDNVPV